MTILCLWQMFHQFVGVGELVQSDFSSYISELPRAESQSLMTILSDIKRPEEPLQLDAAQREIEQFLMPYTDPKGRHFNVFDHLERWFFR